MAGPRQPNIGASPKVFEMLSGRCYSMWLVVASGICGMVGQSGSAGRHGRSDPHLCRVRPDRSVPARRSDDPPARFPLIAAPSEGHTGPGHAGPGRSRTSRGRGSVAQSQKELKLWAVREARAVPIPLLASKDQLSGHFFGPMRLVSEIRLFGFQFLLNAQARRFPHPGAGGSWQRRNPNKTANKGHLL